MAWVYFWFAGFIVEWYGNEPVTRELIHEEVAGSLAPLFYLQMSANLIPIVMLIFKKVRTTPWLLLVATLLVNVGMFTERVLIVVGNLQRNFMPFNWGEYSPTWVEVSIIQYFPVSSPTYRSGRSRKAACGTPYAASVDY
jgi:molybdopterin-containing oxidoreductase family membrane subunit